MFYVPVVSSTGKPLMPTSNWRANELITAGKALRRFSKGVFYIKLVHRANGDTQPVAVGIDPGSKKEGFTVKSPTATYLNVQTDAVTWVKDAVETRRNLRHSRRNRNTPCRQNRSNRAIGGISPSTKARFGWKVRIASWLSKLYPVSRFVVEDIKAHCFGGRRWNKSFSPLQVGKKYFYNELGKIAPVDTLQGYETFELRNQMGLVKSKQKMSSVFEAHCVDSWVLANYYVGGHTVPDNKEMLLITPMQFSRRQLHVQNPTKGDIRKQYGGTRSLGFKRGSWVKHPKYGLCFVGGTSKGRISLHDLSTGKRLTQKAKSQDIAFLHFSSWRTALPPLPKVRGLRAVA
jgi:RRXRR protein